MPQSDSPNDVFRGKKYCYQVVRSKMVTIKLSFKHEDKMQILCVTYGEMLNYDEYYVSVCYFLLCLSGNE